MGQEDILPVTEIDHEAFPSQWPPINYKHELRNKMSHYIVACDESISVELPEVKNHSAISLAGLTSKIKGFFSSNAASPKISNPRTSHHIIGFTGFWVLADEAHIIGIAVREGYRRQGIGELMLISAIEMAGKLKARAVTLEVRESNSIAQNLYNKYAFSKVGIRKGYYLDNREDGVIMTTHNIRAAEFQQHLEQCKEDLCKNYEVVFNPIDP